MHRSIWTHEYDPAWDEQDTFDLCVCCGWWRTYAIDALCDVCTEIGWAEKEDAHGHYDDDEETSDDDL